MQDIYLICMQIFVFSQYIGCAVSIKNILPFQSFEEYQILLANKFFKGTHLPISCRDINKKLQFFPRNPGYT